MTLTDGVPQPVVNVVRVDTALLLSNPRRLRLDLPGGIRVTAIRRADQARFAKSALAAPMPGPSAADAASTAAAGPGPARMWVGDVLGARGGASSVVLILGEDGGLYGSIRFLDRRAGYTRIFEVRADGNHQYLARQTPGQQHPLTAASSRTCVVLARGIVPDLHACLWSGHNAVELFDMCVISRTAHFIHPL